MCRNGCDHSAPSPLRDLLLAIAIFLAVLPFGGTSIYRRLHRQIERTQSSWPTHATAPITHNDPAPTPEATPTPTDSAQTLDNWLPLTFGCFATITFFAFWNWMLRKAQSLHLGTRGYPN
jgi:hypothetical protein